MADNNSPTSFSRFIALLFFSLAVMTGLAAGASVSFDQPSTTVMPGEVISVNLTLDAAPDGISGYRILISMGDPSIGEIIGVTLPGWAGLPEITGVPGSDVRITAVDLMSEVEKGASGILLATVSVKGLSPGTTEILLKDPVFANEDGVDVAPALSNASFTVTTEVSTIPPTTNATTAAMTTATATATTYGSVVAGGSGGGASGSGSSSSPTTVPVTTPIPVTNGTDNSLNATAEQTQSPPPETSPVALSTTLPGATPPVTAVQGIPFLSGAGIMVLVCALVLLGKKLR